MSDATDRVLAAFHKKPKMCLHALSELTQLPYNVLRQACMQMQREGELERVEGANKEDRVYKLVGVAIVESDTPKLPDLFGLDEQTARNRVIMLNRMKRNLICEWHPVIDIILSDYENALKTIEVLREGFDDDETLTKGLKWTIPF